MPPKRKGRQPSQAASFSAGTPVNEPTASKNINTKAGNASLPLQDDHWTDDQEAALFKGIIRWKPENAFGYLSSPDAVQNDDVFYQFSLPREEYGEMMFAKRLAPEGTSSPFETARPQSVASTSAAATRRGSTVEDTEGWFLE
ncbi:MAG: hypothetical protein Q9225_002425 [Loekoesia sp. 1 TL-2023]